MPVIVNRLLERRERLIGALLVGNNVAAIAASSLATGLMLNWFGDVGVIYATVVMTVLIVVFCEVLPKTAAIDSPDRIALAGRASDPCGGARPHPGADRGPLAGPPDAGERGVHDRRERADALRRTRSCAARSISCIAKAAWRSTTATCSAVCSIFPTSRSPT